MNSKCDLKIITTCQVVLLLACLACLLSLSFSSPYVWYDEETGEYRQSAVRCEYVTVRRLLVEISQ